MRVRSCGLYHLPYDFYISKYPVAIAPDGQVRVGTPSDTTLCRVTWDLAARFCNGLSVDHGLTLAYGGDGHGCALQSLVEPATLLQESFRLPTPQEWTYAAHGWSGSRVGDYFSIQKANFKIPYLDYPTTDEQKLFFEQGYSRFDQLIGNHIGIYGMLAYAREWCAAAEPHRRQGRQGIKWEEYTTNYDNDIGYQTVTFDASDQDTLPFRVVLPCGKG